MAIPLNKKPFNLSVEFSAVHQPRQGVPAFNLVAIYDPNGGGDQYIDPYGFDSSIFSNPIATYTQQIKTGLGVNAQSFGTASLRNKNQILDQSPPGAHLYDLNLFTSYGVPKIELWSQKIDTTPPWWQENLS